MSLYLSPQLPGVTVLSHKNLNSSIKTISQDITIGTRKIMPISGFFLRRISERNYQLMK